MQQPQQQPSPALSSPSGGFFAARASPLFSQSVEQPDSTLSSDPHPPPPLPSSSTSSSPLTPPPDGKQAPPKQLAQAMECLSHAVRLIAEIRLGGDMLLEALHRATELRTGNLTGLPAKQAGDFVSRTGDAIAASFEALQATGKRLEALGVLTGAQQQFVEKHSSGLQVPLICSDGAIVAYSWKRQIAGQAAASAVERTRLALKAFTEQKKRRFPRFGAACDLPAQKITKLMSMESSISDLGKVNQSPQGLLVDLLKSWQMAVPTMTITAFTRLKKKPLPFDASSMGKTALLELVFPSVFKVVISLFPSGTMTPDAISVCSTDEVCINAHLGSTSSHAVFRRVSESAMGVLHKFLELADPSTSALNLLLHWLYTYESLFSKPCSLCKKVLALDQPSDVLLPPVIRPFQKILKLSPVLSVKLDELSDEKVEAYHLSCTSKQDTIAS